ncbi:MAG: M2 family metallopeptidase, partial [Deltaproteobacteria bacterium]|nr:M2 family metallopeptidase [Deltaproteobacteria bacterium]
KGLFDRLVAETEEAYKKAKSEIDGLLAKRLKIKPEELMPWDYSDPFFQEAPDLSEGGGKDELFKDSDLLKISLKFFDGIGLDARDILERSSLYEQPDKSPHAFSFSIDRANDIRILTNLKNDEYWLSTLIHELGHALYDKYVEKSLPWLLRQPAHSFTTEGIAQLFERSVKKHAFLQKIAGFTEEKFSGLLPVYEKELRYRQLIFSRWSAVMVNFEMAAYDNPDQDLNKLWWDLVEKFQHLRKPKDRNEPDWASKIHIASAPAYYHNYIMGELFASQLLTAIAAENLKKNGASGVSSLKDVPVEEIRKIDFVDMPWTGEYLKEKVFKPGASKDWREFVKSATGEYLSPEFYAKQFLM